MARQTAAVEVKSFIKGLITEASPLTFPDNASIDEVNFVLNKDGSRKRRNGMDYENNYAIIDTGQTVSDDVGIRSYTWKNPGGFAEIEFIVLQVGTRLTIFNSTNTVVSSSVVATFTIGTDPSNNLSMTSVDGILIVAGGTGDILTFNWDGTTVTQSSGRLKIRDLFGVADVVGGVDLLEGSGVATRPSALASTHIYNLRNQTFAYPHYADGVDSPTDCIQRFFTVHSIYPSNSDNVNTYLYANANDESDRTTKRYFDTDNFNNPLGTNRAPVGFFIIDALNRGATRASEYAKLMSENPSLTVGIGTLPTDSTPGGASVVSSFAGRVWFGGFTSQVNDGDSQSPRMTSYVLFSQLVQSPSDIYKCYQEGDPTSSEIPDLIDTDGGFIRLDGAYNIQQMVNVGDSIMVIAENGVWKITGGSGYGFKATDYLTSKITEHGSIAPSSVVIIDNTFMYWSDDGIYHAAPNQYGDWTVSNLTNTTIQTYFDDIDYLTKVRCQGFYDSYTRQVRWLYNNYIGAENDARELVLDLNLSAFYPSELGSIDGSFPRPLAMIRVPPFKVGNTQANLIDSSANTILLSNGDNVTVTRNIAVSNLSEVYYLTATGVSNSVIQTTFSYYRDSEFLDWKSQNGVGVDAAAYLLTGWTGAGDYQSQKQVPYLTVYSIKTEDGFDSDFILSNESSIKVQSQWNWTNLATAGKWSPQFQAYRHSRVWIPDTVGEAFDDGNLVVTTRNKLRGRGRVLSLRFDTEAGKDFHLLGWSFIVNVNGNV